MKSFKQFFEDVRKMPGGGYGVYADKFVKGKRVTLPSGKHQKELKKVYKNKKDANDYMNRNHDRKRRWVMKTFLELYDESQRKTFVII